MSPQSLTTAAVASGVIFIANGDLVAPMGSDLPASRTTLVETDARLRSIPAPAGSILISLISLHFLRRRRDECAVARITR